MSLTGCTAASRLCAGRGEELGWRGHQALTADPGAACVPAVRGDLPPFSQGSEHPGLVLRAVVVPRRGSGCGGTGVGVGFSCAAPADSLVARGAVSAAVVVDAGRGCQTQSAGSCSCKSAAKGNSTEKCFH